MKRVLAIALALGVSAVLAEGALADAPTANPDSYSTPTNTVLTVPAPGVLGNDVHTGAMTAELRTTASCGTVTLNADGSFTYNPGNGCVGNQNFLYRACHGECSADVTVTITVNNNVPTANPDSYSTPTNTVLTVPAPGVLGNDSDPQLTGQTQQPFFAELRTTASCGTVTLNADGSFTYNPGNGCVGNQNFLYRACDGAQCSAEATVTITVTQSTTAVTFRSLRAARSGKGVRVRWSTASELGTLGFNVYRELNGRRVRVNRSLIGAKGGGVYSYLDRKAPQRKQVRYWLQVVDVDGSTSWRGPVVVRA